MIYAIISNISFLALLLLLSITVNLITYASLHIITMLIDMRQIGGRISLSDRQRRQPHQAVGPAQAHRGGEDLLRPSELGQEH